MKKFILALFLTTSACAPSYARETEMPRFEHAEAPSCMPTQDLEKKIMGEQYKELPLFDANIPNPANNGGPDIIVTVYANPTTGTWFLLMSPNSKISCLIMAGKNFRLPKPRGGRQM